MRKFISVSLLIVVLSVVGFGVLNRQWVRDFYVVQTTDVQTLADNLRQNLRLTEQADFLYQASQPEVLQSSDFNKSCAGVQREQSIVLGCYTRQRFFIYDVDDERLSGVKEVTAAHELLHAVYDRLPKDERDRIDGLVLEAAKTVTNERFQATLAQYRESEPDQIPNELHSILATEVSDLPSDLELHYRRYFQDRSIIVGYATQYEETFSSLEEQIDSYDSNLNNLKNSISSYEELLRSKQEELKNVQNEMQQLRDSGQVEEYNSLVPGYNQQIQNYNQIVALLKQSIDEYNKLVEKRNSLATTQNDLAKELNSNYQPLR